MRLYTFSIRLYGVLLYLASFFHTKAGKWIRGRIGVFQRLETAMRGVKKPVVWFHVASLGEFEQARPVIEGLREKHKDDIFLLLSFFSPSGYEVRHDYAQADFVTYLPLDTPAHAKRWLDIVQPSVAYWVKYEFWWNMLVALQKREVPIILFSALFRKEQFFFKPSAHQFLDVLRNFECVFVQNKESLALLKQYDFQNVEIAGDTRFDRVLANVEHFEPLPLVEAWAGKAQVLVAGSVWERDLAVMLPVLAQNFSDLKVIFAPHEIHESILQKIEKTFPNQTIRYSKLLSKTLVQDKKILLIDNVGMLARLYHYGKLAYVGGAFKEGLHNILEPAAFGVPVVFGHNYKKFPEANALIKAGGAFSIQDQPTFHAVLQKYLTHEAHRQEAGRQAKQFIEANRGGAARILRYNTLG